MITKNFNLQNFECPCCGKVHKSLPDFIKDRLQPFRDMVGLPLIVNSGYRCEEYNATVPGASAVSQHLIGLAVDVYCPSEAVFPPRTLAVLAWMSRLFRGIKYYDTHVHLDARALTLPFWGPQFRHWDRVGALEETADTVYR